MSCLIWLTLFFRSYVFQVMKVLVKIIRFMNLNKTNPAQQRAGLHITHKENIYKVNAYNLEHIVLCKI